MAISSIMNKGYWQWARKGGWAVLDQALFSSANFILSLMLARWMTPVQYGSFSIGFSIFLLIAGLQNAFLLEPMSIIGPAQHKGHLKKYNAVLLRLQLCLSLLIVFILLLISMFIKIFNNKDLSELFIVIAAASPFILLFWLVRRMPYLENEPRIASLGTFTYFNLVILLTISIRYYNITLSPKIAYFVLAFSSLTATLTILLTINYNLKTDNQIVNTHIVSTENWRYGKWVAITSIVYWLSGDIYLFLSAGFLGLEEAAALKALSNLVMPLNQIITALGLVILPIIAGRFGQVSSEKMNRDIVSIGFIFTVISIVYIILLFIFDDTLISIIYNNKYISYRWLLIFIGISAFLNILGSGYQIGLKSRQKPNAIFNSYTLSAFFSIIVGTSLIKMVGIKGAAMSIVCTSALGTFTLYLQWRCSSDKREKQGKKCL